MDGRDDQATVNDVERARRRFITALTEPDPSALRRWSRRIGSIEANEASSGRRAGSLSFAVDRDHDLPVQTVQFTTEPEFRKCHVALLLAFDLSQHYGGTMLRSSPMDATDDGRHLLDSLRRRGLMVPND